MSKKSLVWIRDDLRIKDNPALSYATNNHEIVSVLYIYNSYLFDGKREAQKWWLYKSLVSLRKHLLNSNINLEIISGKEINLLKKIKKEQNLSIYWNKVYEPNQEKLEKEFIDHLEKEKINYKFFKGNILLEFQEVKKDDGTPFKVFTPFWKNAEQKYLKKNPSKPLTIKKLKKIEKIFKKTTNEKEILPIKNWYKKFENYWIVSENNSKKIIVDEDGKLSSTTIELVQQFKDSFLARIKINTGRMHQIRVHSSSIGHPICGDTEYGNRDINEKFRKLGLKRIFLHSCMIKFDYKRKYSFTNSLPDDLESVVNNLKNAL